MGLKNILGKDVKLIMVGGKGGVGKTTCASAIALKIAAGGKRVLVISSDPTPSLSDIFEVQIGSKETRIVHEAPRAGYPLAGGAIPEEGATQARSEGEALSTHSVREGEAPTALLLEGATQARSEGEALSTHSVREGEAPTALLLEGATQAPVMELYGLEISSDVVLTKWKERFGAEIYEIISTFASVDYDFVDYIGTAPGIEEEYMLSFIIDLVDGGKYDVVVWDTAPAGHTLRLLQLPHLFLKHLEAATKFYMNMYSYFDKLKDMAKLKGSKRTLLEIIGSWEALAEKIVGFIRDDNTTKYVIVTIPEALGVRLTDRVIKEFQQNRLKVENIIINHAVKEEDCEFHRIRKGMQKYYIDFIKESYKQMNIVTLYLAPHEVKGIKRITEVAGELFSG